MAGCLACLWRNRNYVVIVVTPLMLLPLPLTIPGSEAECAYVILLMAVYWCTECIPLAVTALLPIIFFPMMGIMESTEVCAQYLPDSNMLFIGGLLMAIAVEHWSLHKRIALGVMLLVGVKPSLLMLGFMAITGFLSMWISNTACTAMMVPIVHALVKQLSDTEAKAEDGDSDLIGQLNQAFEPTDTDKNMRDSSSSMGVCMCAETSRIKREQKYANLSKGLSLSVCYAASIGGTATLTGTAPNVILKGQIDELFPENGDIINFTSWFAFAFPYTILLLGFCWLWLHYLFLGFSLKKSFVKNDGDREAYQIMKDEYKRLGSMSFAEGCVLAVFTVLVVLWFTREPSFIPGWATALNKDKPYVTDGTVAILLSVLLFCIPSRIPRCRGTSEDGQPLSAPPALLNWPTVHEKMPWNMILLLGGGFAMAKGSEASGLSKWLGDALSPLQNIPPFATCILLSLLVVIFTECLSNIATTTLFLPILASMATAINLHPLYVMLPCTFCASLGFMLPVATPPNAIVFSYGNITLMEMAKAGSVLNIMGVIIINIAVNTWGVALFQLNTFPSWANTTKAP
ncbi:solute carrier family 13 member 2-like [Myripristis murdjan]|uniref:solute carrier family 13 member 2-like n=1 Tax=Myripristis murdjan TaxID=586833 RepID=UPI0011762643|nr:solute carrier family 13 member 2-like [Myripristis murdjan]